MTEAHAAHSRWIVELRAEHNRRLAEAARVESEAGVTGHGLVAMLENVEIKDAPVFKSHPTRGLESAHEASSAAAVEKAWMLKHPPLVSRQPAFQH